MIIGIILGALVLICGIYFFSTQRTLVNCDEKCKNALSQIGVQLKTRYDAIIALVKLTREYSQHEHDTLMDTIKARKFEQPQTAKDVMAMEQNMQSVFGRLMAVAEQYPDLKANQLYMNTQESIKGYEENVRISRMVYNDTCTQMNRMVRQWPSSFVANMLHFGTQEYLQTDEKTQEFPQF